MQITTTILSPTFVLAANFIIVVHIIRKLGPQYSRLSPRLYTIVFCSCDVVALIVQSVGGAMASLAKNMTDADKGGHITLGGIAFQFTSIVVYMILTLEFLIRFYLNKPFYDSKGTLTQNRSSVDAKTMQMILGICLSSLSMFIRGIYRTIELTGGWSGSVISNQALFVGFDGSMIVFALVALNIFHPGRLMTDDFDLTKLGSMADMETFEKAVLETPMANAPDRKSVV